MTNTCECNEYTCEDIDNLGKRIMVDKKENYPIIVAETIKGCLKNIIKERKNGTITKTDNES